MNYVFIFLGSLMILGTAIPFLKKEYWWIRVFDFPRLQIITVAILILVGYIIFWDYRNFWENFFLVILFAAILHQLNIIYPYTPFHKKEVLDCSDHENHVSFSLVVMNVYQYNRKANKAKIILQSCDPDIIIALETDEWWKEQLSFLEEDYLHTVLIPLENTYGMLLYSKFELTDTEVRNILVEDVPSIHTKVIIKNSVIRLHAVHPEPPAPGHSEKSTKRDAELITVAKDTRNHEEPVIVAGDLNDVAWSYTTSLFQRYSELLDPRIGRGMFNTFHAKHRLLRWPLDHVFHSDHFQLAEMRTLEEFGSDHFPIFIKLCFKPNESHKQDEPEAEKEDREMAQGKLNRAQAQSDLH